jgi:hypothetical protein
MDTDFPCESHNFLFQQSNALFVLRTFFLDGQIVFANGIDPARYGAEADQRKERRGRRHSF